MSDWIHGLPLGWMAILIFGGTFLSAAVILLVVHSLAVGERARAFKAVSPGLLPPLGIMFGLLVAFLAAQAWGDQDRAHTEVNREASALRAVVLQAICTLTAIAMVHVDNRTTAAIAMGLFSTAIAVCIMLITAHDRPFVGRNAVQSTALLQVQPDASANTGR
jgi:hypothetical protein